MIQFLHVHAPHALLFIHDAKSTDVAMLGKGQVFASNPGWVTVGTVCEEVGTDVVVAVDEEPDGASAAVPDYVGILDTPSGELVIENTEHDRYFATVVPQQTPLRVWINDDVGPDEITIVIGVPADD